MEDNINEMPSEELQQDTGIANQLIDLIKRKYELIETYNNLKVSLDATGNEEVYNEIDSLLAYETSSIGNLTAALTLVQPGIEDIDLDAKPVEK